MIKFYHPLTTPLNRKNFNQLLNIKNIFIMKNSLIIFVLLSSPLFIFGQNEWNDSATFALASNTMDIEIDGPHTNLYPSYDLGSGLAKTNKRVEGDNLKSTTDEVVLLPKVVTAFKPVIDVTENHIDLNCLSDGNPISVSVFSENDKIFTDVYEKERSISKRYDISKLPRGSYTFNVSAGNTTYSKRFSK